ncbi:hypothetical protein GCM10009109_23580 [Marinobacterium sediminicola]
MLRRAAQTAQQAHAGAIAALTGRDTTFDGTFIHGKPPVAGCATRSWITAIVQSEALIMNGKKQHKVISFADLNYFRAAPCPAST